MLTLESVREVRYSRIERAEVNIKISPAVVHVKALEYLEAGGSSEAFNLGTGQGSTVQEVVDLARRISERDFPIEYVGRRSGDPVAIWADASKAERLLSWKAQYDLETIVRTAWTWHSTHPDGFKEL